MIIKLVCLFCVSNVFLLCATQEDTLVSIPQGYLRGDILTAKNGRNFSSFLGIPYAQPPVGDLRFRNPIPAEKWNGVLSAHKEGNDCAQVFFDNNIYGKEDCLYLNVYTPLLKFNGTMDKSKLLPVMVWIHGGGFYFGSSSPDTYGPKYLLDKDVVIVAMNYRLGIFGFLTTGDSVAPGNFGMKDQVLALKWVQKNIKNFGGDPSRVTIFGQSAGGASVNLHALSDSTHGLFHQYIIQSGSALGPWVYRSKKEYKPYINEIAENVGCSNMNSEDLVHCLRNRSVEILLKAKVAKLQNFPEFIWVPTDELGTEDAYLTDSPQNLISQNKMRDVPSMSGTVVDEGLFITLNMYANYTPIDEIKHRLEISMNYTSKYYLKPKDSETFKRIIEEYYFNESSNSVSKDKFLRNYTDFLSDSASLYPQANLIERMANVSKSPFYFYSFGYFSLNKTKIYDFFDIKKNLGVNHGDELAFIFSPNKTDILTYNDEKILNLMVDLWTSFAINGKPTSSQLEDSNLWQPYVENKSFLQIGNTLNNTDPSVTLDNNYFSSRMNFWKKQFPLF